MSRRPAKQRAVSGKAVGPIPFVCFSTASSASGLSYLTEPPDFSAISDANVTVSLKNLQKKDATTKAKALEELVSYVQSHPHDLDGGTEEPILDAWEQLYPRVSIDNARRVRELSHALQYELMKSARKRMERRLPKVVGSWLAGTFDKDRVVSRAATEGLSSFLTSEEKTIQFWKKCQPQILEYAAGAIQETPDTLSDDRTTNPEDSASKYHRVLGGCLALVLNLLQKLEPSDRAKYQDSYDRVFEADKVWTSITIDDAAVRRQSCQLLCACLKQRPETLGSDLGRVCKAFINDGLRSRQVGSAADFVSALADLTERYPAVWTASYQGKRIPSARIRTFLEKGSQGSDSIFWDFLNRLLSSLPEGVLPTDFNGSTEFLRSMRAGITGREEPRSHATNAWICYLNTARLLLQASKEGDTAARLIRENIFPLTEAYMFPSAENTRWSTGVQMSILLKAYNMCATWPSPEVTRATVEEWNLLKNKLTERMRHPASEAPKDHERLQNSIADGGCRWFSLTGKILEGHQKTVNTDRPIPDVPQEPSEELLLDALKILAEESWKPFGAAAIVEAAFKQSPALWVQTSPTTVEVLGRLRNALSGDGGRLASSSSAPYLFSSIHELAKIPQRQRDYAEIWTANVEAALANLEDPGRSSALVSLASSDHASALAHQLPELQAELAGRCMACAEEADGSDWELFETVARFKTLSVESTRTLVRNLASKITDPTTTPKPQVVRGLRVIAQNDPSLLTQDSDLRTSLINSLLRLSETAAADAELAMLRSLIESPANTRTNLMGIIRDNIHAADPVSLSVDTVVAQAAKVLPASSTTSKDAEQNGRIDLLMPDPGIWMQDLSLFMLERPNAALCMTTPVGGAVFLAHPPQGAARPAIQRDRDGCSVSGRMGKYTAKLLQSGYPFSSTPASVQEDILICLMLTDNLITDQLVLSDNHRIWDSVSDVKSNSEAYEVLEAIQVTVKDVIVFEAANDWRDGAGNEASRLAHSVVEKLLEASRPLTPLAWHSARALSAILDKLSSYHGFPSRGETWLAEHEIFKTTTASFFPTMAVLSGLGNDLTVQKPVNNFLNRLVSDVAEAELRSDKTLILLALLGASSLVCDTKDGLPVANNRLVFAVRHITSWLDTPEQIDHRFASAMIECLRVLLRNIKDVYGSYWERTINFCIYLWTLRSAELREDRLPYLKSSIYLILDLEKLRDPNDDLVEALEGSAETRSAALINLLKLPREKHTGALNSFDDCLCRTIAKIPIEHIKDPTDLYSLIASDSRTIQTSAFSLLHKTVPAAQVQLSVDVLLEKKDAQLPDELLSLLLEAPTLEAYSDDDLAKFPTPIRAYLLSWLLIFDAFSASSLKVRGDYTENLKQANYVGPLLEFTFDVLGHSAACALNLDKANFSAEDITSYDLKLAEDAETDERNMQWLLIHLYYLVLRYTPGLFKAWFLDCRSKQTRTAVENWMTKYFSPIIIAEVLDDVSKWASTQEGPAAEDDGLTLIVKVSRAAKEVTAGYEVDELRASITIRVPRGFPLESVTVVGNNRVAVNERKWQSWIMTTQAVILFSGGSIIDGLSAFRRNVVGALKGQTECAICYSIIGSDKKMPDKRCTTCNNTFHRICLYKWFQSSSQNTCPLCRNPIDYLGADTRARRGGA